MLVLIAALLSVLGTSQAAVTPTGPTVNLQAILDNGDILYVENAAQDRYTVTDTVAAAAVFTLDESTGFFYQATTDLATYPSGYIVPAVTSSDILGVLELEGYDGTVVQGNGYYPLACTGSINLLGLTDVSVPLTCGNQLLSGLVGGFGVCPSLDNIIVNYGVLGVALFPLRCESSLLADDARTITQFNAVLAPGATNPNNPGGGGVTTTPNGATTIVPPNLGPCSVTVSVIVTTTTVFVAAPYNGPATSGSGGSTTGPNPYGCQPITTIVELF